MKRRIILFAYILLIPFNGISSNSIPDSVRVERLAALGKLWGSIKYFHPYTAYKDIDWDSALVQAIPKVYDAQNIEEYADAVQSMCNFLDDPLTKVEFNTNKSIDTTKVTPLSFS